VEDGDPLEVAERLARTDSRQRSPVVPRKLAAQLVDEARLVRGEVGERDLEDERGNVVGAVLRDREEEQRDRASGVVVEAAQQPKSSSASRPSGINRMFPRCGSAW
jgi:hypothetical protein